jgi:membrane protease YdiL (CAAX protease family)
MAGLFWGLLCLLLCAPKLKAAPRILGLAALLYGLNELAVAVPYWWWHTFNFSLQHNWMGKLFSIVLCLLVIYGVKWVRPAEVGLTRPLPGSLRIVVPVVLFFALIEFTDAFINRHHHLRPTLESHLYQFLMPGIAEELFFRGVFLGLLSRVFPRTIPFFGTRTSWGGVVGVLLFVLGHCLDFSKPLMLLPELHFSLGKVFGVGLYGTLYLWVRERSGSCWAAMLAHNLLNTCLYAGWSFA